MRKQGSDIINEGGEEEEQSRTFGAVAQLGERVPCKHEAEGSSPSSSIVKMYNFTYHGYAYSLPAVI